MCEPISPVLRDKLSQISTATGCMNLYKMGLRNVFMQGLHPLAPLGIGTRLVGRAATLRFLPLREDIDAALTPEQRHTAPYRRAVESIEPGDILVIDAMGYLATGTFGDDIMILATFVQGAVGVVSGGSHLVGDRIRLMIQKFFAGDMPGARNIHQQLHPLWRAFCPNGRVNPMPLARAALELVGWPVGPARMPLDSATDDERAAMKRVLAKLGLVQRKRGN